MSIVTKSGLSIAEVPKSDDDQTHLSNALMAAILSFSKEVHQSDLEGLSFHDRNISFIPIGDFFIIAETRLSLDKHVRNKIFRELTNHAQELLDRINIYDIDESIGHTILKDLISKDWLDDTLDKMGIAKPLEQAEIFVYDESGGDITYSGNEGSKLLQLRENLLNRIDLETLKLQRVMGLYLRTEDLQRSFLAFLHHDNVELDIFGISVPLEMDNKLFKITPDLILMARSMIDQGKSYREILDEVKNIRDVSESVIDLKTDEDLSFKYLDNSFKSGLESGLTSLILGDQVIVVGDKTSVRVVSKTLTIFSQHFSTDIVPWLADGVKIGRNITGMSVDRLQEFQSSISPEEFNGLTIFNLNSSEVTGGVNNKFIQKLYKDIRKKNQDEIIKIVSVELGNLVNDSLELTDVVQLDDELAKQELRKFKKIMKDNSRFDLVVELTKKRNPLIAPLIEEISSSLSSAEDFFSQL